MSSRLLGFTAATHTPFDASGQLRLEIVAKQAEHLQKQQIPRVFIGGTTGESHSLTADERKQLAAEWMKVTRGTPLEVVVHVGANSLEDCRALAAHAESVGARAIAALAPSYFRPRSVDLLVDSMQQIAAAAPATPFYYYDIPSMTGVNFPVAEFLQAARDKIPTLTGVKYTNSDLAGLQRCLKLDDGRFDVLFGCDEYYLAAATLGVQGGVGSTYNFAAPVYHRMLAHYAAGDLPAAREEQHRSVLLVELLVRYGFMAAAKTVMGFLGVEVGPARLPHANLTSEQKTTLRRELETLGFFSWIQ